MEEELVNAKKGRNREKTTKYKESIDVLKEEMQMDPNTCVIVECSQTKKLHNVKVKDLSREDLQPLTTKDLVHQRNLILQYKGKPWPVMFVKYKEKNKGGKKDNVAEILQKAKHDAFTASASSESDEDTLTDSVGRKRHYESESGSDHEIPFSKMPKKDNLRGPTTILDISDKDLIFNLAKEVKCLRQELRSLSEKIGAFRTKQVTMIKEENEYAVKLKRLSARDPYTFALQAMDALFSKDELASSLLFSSKKSAKPALDKVKVEEMLSTLDDRFGPKSYDIKLLTSKANQKCRDSKVCRNENNEDNLAC